MGHALGIIVLLCFGAFLLVLSLGGAVMALSWLSDKLGID